VSKLPVLLWGMSHTRKLEPIIAAAIAAVMAMPFLLAKLSLGLLKLNK
jgi:hypothetical protein